MKKFTNILVKASMLTTICLTSTLSSEADIRNFTIDSANSSLSISGNLLGIEAEEQSPGSLSTTYSGSIVADVTETTISFPGGSSIVADNSGSWQPAADGESGSAAANYGAKAGNFLASGMAALRDVLFDVTSGSITMLGGTFAADSLEFSLPETASSRVDYSYSGFLSGMGSEPLAGRATNDVVAAADISEVDGELLMTIPIDYTLVLKGDFEAEFRVVGQIVAKVANDAPLMIPVPDITPGHLGFSIPTEPGRTYTILASTDLIDFSTVVDQFEGDGTTMDRDIEIPSTGLQFFILRVE